MSRHLEPVRSFLEQLEARDRREGAILAREFSDIKARSVAWKTEGVCSTKAGSQLGNTRKNRYKDVVPCDPDGMSRDRKWTVLAYGSVSIVRSCLWLDGTPLNASAFHLCTKQAKKCERYWAQEQEPLQTGPFRVTLMKETPVNADIILRTLQVTFQKESRSVHQLQYMSWPDHGVPSHPDHILAMVEEARRLQGVGPGPLCVHCSAGCGRTGVLCAVDYVRQLLLTQSHPISASSKWSLRCANSGLLQCRQSDYASQQEQYRFLYHTVAQLFSSTLQNASPHYQNLKENCAPICKDALSLRTSPALPAVSRPPGGVLRSISVPGPPTLPMADTYAVVQKRGAPAGTGPGTRAPSSADTPIYSQVAARAQRPIAQTEDAQGTSPLGRVPADQNPPGPDAYEEVTNGAQTGGLGFNMRIGRPKGPREPPAEWTRV
ncbi:tyrosine-protein phosphatase non-receptor type 18 isoform X6 [Psammomys obesus]|uniref:tyrosine-protein phosphatase non-receptor type 18 isoform X6 n=1 Tax=Psammomys obesus TaxID=48139 RepID=UPI002452D204|nr:tyrosine-protein phosphatase non-receptor type 18 isoform X6 [Psammomys obesus]